jgi:hypothetical protein
MLPSKWFFDHLNLTVNAGQFIALVGQEAAARPLHAAVGDIRSR